MEKFLYLKEKSWVQPWIEGGEVPLYNASKYKSAERDGIYTPDENLIDVSTHSVEQVFGDSVPIMGSNIIFEGAEINGVSYPFIQVDRTFEDGLVLCLANRRSDEIAKGLKKLACVKILSIEYLKEVLDEQIGIKSLSGPCKYTTTHIRDSFTKSTLDSWQDEFRLFWPGVESRSVHIPQGIAIRIPIRCG